MSASPRLDGWKQAALLWTAFLAINVILNGTVQFILGWNVRDWTFSTTKFVLYSLTVYSFLFLWAPLVLSKGLRFVGKRDVALILTAASLGIALFPLIPYSAAVVVPALAYLHWRYDLSGLGMRSKGINGDLGGVVLLGSIQLLPLLIVGGPLTVSLSNGISMGLRRWFSNPASTVENLFYFGFMAERFAGKFGRWATPFIIGAMYTTHEMSNPEYWYGGAQFGTIFIGLTIWAAIYLWRRSVVVVWLGDGLGRLLSGLV